jgi:uncharacterized protein
MTPTTTDAALVVRTTYEAFARGDIPAVLDAMDPEVVWIETAGGPYGGTYRGPQAVLEGLFEPLARDWEGFVVDVDHLVSEGGAVATAGTYRGTCRSTGRSMATRFVHLWTVDDGRCRRLEQVADTATMIAAMS